MNNSADLLAGVDSIRLDTRNLEIAKEDIEKICLSFRLGEIKNYEKEKNIAVSHSNFFIFLATTRGEYALKLYPSYEEKNINTELVLNRLLINNRFPTPAMHMTRSKSAFLRINQYSATCFDFINGQPAYQHRLETKTIRRINERILHLKTILNQTTLPTGLLQTEDFSHRISALLKGTRQIEPFDNQKLVSRSLLRAHEIWTSHRNLFIQKILHNNISLSNLFWSQNTVYILDLSHIKTDYELSDLASLVISCLFLDLPNTTIKAFIKNYFSLHEMETRNLPVLTACLNFGLIKEYLKTERRRRNVAVTDTSSGLDRLYRLKLKQRKKLITDTLQTFQSNTKPPFYP